MQTLVTALALGFAAGITPGPLLTLVLTSTLQRGFGAGWRVSLAPLSDGPIIALAILVLKDLDPRWLAAITAAGGLFVVWLGIQTVRTPAPELDAGARLGGGPADIGRGVLVNMLNPHPWLFWIGVGGPVLVAAWRDGSIWAVGFLVIFYGLLVGLKVILAWVTARGSRFLTGVWYRRLLVGSGVLLVVLGLMLFGQGVSGWTR